MGKDNTESGEQIMYMFIKMSSSWFCKTVQSISSSMSNAMEHVRNGEIIAYADDIEGFADEMGIEVEDIEMA